MKNIMDHAATRLLACSVLVVGVHFFLASWTEQGLRPPNIEKPTWRLDQIDKQLGNWRGQDRELDPRIFIQTGAVDTVDREYVNAAENLATLHCAYFEDYFAGAFHNPSTCFRSQGWQAVKFVAMEVKTPDGGDQQVNARIWERDGQRQLVVYWYRLDEHVALDRWDLGWINLKLRGRETWPVLVKILLTMTIEDLREDEKQMQEFAQYVYDAVYGLGREVESDSEDKSGSESKSDSENTAEKPAQTNDSGPGSQE